MIKIFLHYCMEYSTCFLRNGWKAASGGRSIGTGLCGSTGGLPSFLSRLTSAPTPWITPLPWTTLRSGSPKFASTESSRVVRESSNGRDAALSESKRSDPSVGWRQPPYCTENPYIQQQYLTSIYSFTNIM